MVDKNNEFEQLVFDKIIQCNVEFYTKDGDQDNIIKKGKLLNFNIKLPFFYFIIESKNKSREYPLPQPFNFEYKNNEIVMSYELSDTIQDKNIVDKMRKLGNISESKIFDKKLYIRIANE